MILIDILIVLVLLGVVALASSIRVVKQYERGVVLRLGRLQENVRPPGLTMIVPGIDRLRKVNMQIVTMPVPGQEGITRDNVTVRVDAVVYFNVIDAARAVINVEDYLFAMGQVAQASLRSIIGKSDLDDLLSDREKLNQGLEVMIDSPALNWGVHIDRVEIKDVSLPEAMKRSIARQAEAERERRSRIISADGEFQASRRLSDAAKVMSDTPSALQLRLLETVVEVAAEKNSTLVLPFPVELLRFVDQVHTAAGDGKREAEPTEEPAQKTATGEPGAGEPSGPQERRPTPEELALPLTGGAATGGVPGHLSASTPAPRQPHDEDAPASETSETVTGTA